MTIEPKRLSAEELGTAESLYKRVEGGCPYDVGAWASWGLSYHSAVPALLAHIAYLEGRVEAAEALADEVEHGTFPWKHLVAFRATAEQDGDTSD